MRQRRRSRNPSYLVRRDDRDLLRVVVGDAQHAPDGRRARDVADAPAGNQVARIVAGFRQERRTSTCRTTSTVPGIFETTSTAVLRRR